VRSKAATRFTLRTCSKSLLVSSRAFEYAAHARVVDDDVDVRADVCREACAIVRIADVAAERLDARCAARQLLQSVDAARGRNDRGAGRGEDADKPSAQPGRRPGDDCSAAIEPEQLSRGAHVVGHDRLLL
jgi:hypothetical protein